MRSGAEHGPRADDTDERATWVWVGVGCGGLALSLLCILPPAVWLTLSREGEGDDPVPVVAPVVPTPVDPGGGARPPGGGAPPPGGGALPPPPPPTGATSARRVTAVVEEASGSIRARPGTTCSFDVTRHEHPDGTFWCNAQVVCVGQLLYGGQGAGFFDCTLYEQPQRHVVGEDPNTTAADGDAAMRLDTLRGTLTVRDDIRGRLGAFSLRARVTAVQ